ncbi:uncharacterized protein LOC131802241 [Musca domestica]|uniref:Uncharacterized protein LOC131802241 n=1 Tax=Musca domestica TaxID=7370 RepID=A0ABM3UX19_MUSDO|nr:uncharacterized protein LOC131802241 [Musca domestica]
MNYTLFTKDPEHLVKVPQSEEIDNFVAMALRFLIQNVLLKLCDSVFLTISTTSPATELWFEDVLAKLFASWGYMAITIVRHNSKRQDVVVPGRRFCNMIMVDSFENLQRTNISQHNSQYDTQEYYIIFLQIRDAQMPEERAKILQYCLDNYWLHCNVMIQNAKGEVLIYTYFPFQEDACFSSDPVLINQFDGVRFVNDVMFPIKVQNLYGCPIRMNLWEIPPFILFPDNTTEIYTGLEMIILKTLSKHLNFTIDEDSLAERRDLGDDRMEPFKVLQRRETNITAGFFRRTPERDDLATSTYVTFSVPLAAVVVRRESGHESLNVLIFPFDMPTWVLLIISSLILIIINYFRQKNVRSASTWQIIESLLGLPSVRIPERLSPRVTFIIWMLSTFVLRLVYQSILFFLYRTQFYRQPPTTVIDFAVSGYRAVCTQPTAPLLTYIPQFMDNSLPLIVLNTTDEMAPLRYIDKNSHENLVAITVRDFVFYYVHTELSRSKVFILMQMSLNDQKITFYVPKHSYLAERLENCILGYHQMGFMELWRKLTYESFRISQSSYSTKYEAALLVNLRQIMSFIYLVVFLQSASIVIFVLELLSKKFDFLKKLF